MFSFEFSKETLATDAEMEQCKAIMETTEHQRNGENMDLSISMTERHKKLIVVLESEKAFQITFVSAQTK